MTDRIKGVWVAFDRDIRTDDVEPLLEALKCFRGVSSVTTSTVHADDWMNRDRIRNELSARLYEVLHSKRTET